MGRAQQNPFDFLCVTLVLNLQSYTLSHLLPFRLVLLSATKTGQNTAEYVRTRRKHKALQREVALARLFHQIEWFLAIQSTDIVL